MVRVKCGRANLLHGIIVPHRQWINTGYKEAPYRLNSAKSARMNAETTAILPFNAVLLAAGAGSRLGGRPKALLELDGVPLIRRLIAALNDAGASEIVIVLGHYADAIDPALRGLPIAQAARVKIVTNPSPDEGQTTSLRIGLHALASNAHATMIALCDQPLIDVRDVDDLLHAFGQRGATQMLVPRVAGKPGNPVVIDAALKDEWLHGDVDATGQRWRKLYPERVYGFDSDNPHYRIDIDTDHDIAQFNLRTGQTLSWPTP